MMFGDLCFAPISELLQTHRAVPLMKIYAKTSDDCRRIGLYPWMQIETKQLLCLLCSLVLLMISLVYDVFDCPNSS